MTTKSWTFGGTWPYEPRWFESADVAFLPEWLEDTWLRAYERIVPKLLAHLESVSRPGAREPQASK
jgi:hypothetical protein